MPAEARLEPEVPSRQRFLYGSQIYLKTTQCCDADIEVIRPFFPNLYVWLYAKGKDKGFICTKDEQIDF
jgi:hypothetical protein